MPPEQTEATGTAGYSKDELATLTPDELSALQADDGDPDGEIAALAATEETAAAPAVDGEAAAAAPAEAPAAPAAAEAIEPAPAPVTTLYKTEAPADLDKQLAYLKTAKAEAKAEETKAMKQLMDGDIDFDAYQAAKDKADAAIEAANESISDLKSAATRATVSQEMTQQQTQRTWDAEVAASLKSAKDAGLDYAAKPELQKELNSLVRAFGAQATENGLDDSKGLEASKWALAQAHDVMRAKHGKPAAPASTPAGAPGAQRHDVKTLGALPNADRTAVTDDVMSRLGSLSGEELEIAMARMSPADVDRILAVSDA